MDNGIQSTSLTYSFCLAASASDEPCEQPMRNTAFLFTNGRSLRHFRRLRLYAKSPLSDPQNINTGVLACTASELSACKPHISELMAIAPIHTTSVQSDPNRNSNVTIFNKLFILPYLPWMTPNKYMRCI